MLDAPFSEEDIKNAVWSCDGSKAPGPDGFSFSFIKANWDLLKQDITASGYGLPEARKVD